MYDLLLRSRLHGVTFEFLHVVTRCLQTFNFFSPIFLPDICSTRLPIAAEGKLVCIHVKCQAHQYIYIVLCEGDEPSISACSQLASCVWPLPFNLHLCISACLPTSLAASLRARMFDEDLADLQQQLKTETTDTEATSRGKTLPKAKASSKKKANQQAKPCFICTATAMKGKRWCQEHNQAYDCLYYQAKKKGELEVLEACMANAQTAASAIQDFISDNVTEGKWKRRAVIDWTAFKRQYVMANIRRSREGTTPFEFTQWLRRCESVMGWPESAAKDEWEKYKKDPSIEQDAKGLAGCLRLWLPILEEKHKDREVARINSVEEGSNQDKRMSGEDRDALLDFARSDAGANTDRWFSRCQPPDADGEGPDFVTSKKRPAPDSDPASKGSLTSSTEAETPAEKKARVRFERLNGPALTAFKNTWANKILDKATAMEKLLDNALAKIKDGELKIQDQPEKDDVLSSYETVLKACSGMVAAWKVPASEHSQEAVQEVDDKLAAALTIACSDVKVTKEGSIVHSKSFFKFHAQELMQATDAKLVEDNCNRLLKTEAAVVDLLAKSLSKIAGDVISYAKQKDKSRQRELAKKKKEAEAKDLEACQARAKEAAAKVKMFNKHSHSIFAIEAKEWRPFPENDGKDFKVDDHLDKPWVLRGSDVSKAWRNNADVTVKLSEFGGSYKKAPSFKSDGRVMAPVAPKAGREGAERMMQTLFPCQKRLGQGMSIASQLPKPSIL